MTRPAGATWTSEVERTSFKWSLRAKDAGMANDVQGFIAMVEAKVKNWVEAAEVRRRIDEAGLIGVLNTGQFLPLLATGTSASGVTDPGTRALDEQRIFDIDPSAAASERPIYCYLEGSDESGAVATYGPIVFGFGKSVRSRSTFVLGDTRDSTLTAPTFAPVPLTAPSIMAVSNMRRGLLTATSLAEASDLGYAEVQVHGGLSASEITRVVYTRNVRPSASALDALRSAGLTPSYVRGDDPGPPGH